MRTMKNFAETPQSLLWWTAALCACAQEAQGIREAHRRRRESIFSAREIHSLDEIQPAASEEHVGYEPASIRAFGSCNIFEPSASRVSRATLANASAAAVDGNELSENGIGARSDARDGY